jgi:hypothetical protein
VSSQLLWSVGRVGWLVGWCVCARACVLEGGVIGVCQLSLSRRIGGPQTFHHGIIAFK